MYALKMSPDAGPPTAFANAEHAYLRLPDGLKAKLEGLSIVNLVDFDSFQGQDTIRTRRLDLQDVDDKRFVHATHPAVVRLPITNRPVLLVNEHQTSHFVGMDPDESENLYLELLQYLYPSDNILWHDWEVGDFVVWNNLAIHHGRPTAPVGTRELRRMIVSTAA
jgi:taurine dioxygenase